MRTTDKTKSTMKQYLYILCFATITLLWGSCDKNETPVFDTNYSAINIWFGTESSVLDSVTYNYSYTLEKDSIMFLCRVVGLPVDYDRTFVLEAYDGDIDEAAGSYTLGSYTIPAGESEAEYPIYFDTSKLTDNQSFTQNDGHLYFRVQANELFATGADNMSTLKVVLRNYLAQPEEWYTQIPPYLTYQRYFGEYSKTKYQFMIQTLGLVDFHIAMTSSVPYDEETNTISSSYASYLVDRMKEALIEYNATHEKPLTDEETGEEVVF